jgi:hypothetical protein
MGLNLKNNEKLSKIITVILVGVLMLIVVMPVKDVAEESKTNSENMSEGYSYITKAEYYEEKLKKILEESYGKGNIQVMVRVSEGEKTDAAYYNSGNEEVTVEGVFIVADVNSTKAVSDITFAVCALFDLPAHKVAVMIKN